MSDVFNRYAELPIRQTNSLQQTESRHKFNGIAWSLGIEDHLINFFVELFLLYTNAHNIGEPTLHFFPAASRSSTPGFQIISTLKCV